MANTRSVTARSAVRNPRETARIRKNEAIFLFVLSGLLLGIAVGAIQCYAVEPARYHQLSEQLQGFLSNIDPLRGNNADIFLDSMIKHGKILAIIWFLAFLPPFSLASVPLIFIKGMSNGFTTALFIRAFGFRGLAYACALYLPQSLALIPAYLFVCCAGLNFTLLQMRRNRANREKQSFRKSRRLSVSDAFPPPAGIEKSAVTAYITALLIGGALTAAAALTETYITPFLIRMVI